jgi:hypothetical protein
MRVTHIHHINGQLLIVRQSNVIQSFWCIRNKWNFLWQELWIAHIHAYPAILTEFGFYNPCLGLLDSSVEIELAGGKLHIEWREGDVVWMTGPTSNVYEGRIDLSYYQN